MTDVFQGLEMRSTVTAEGRLRVVLAQTEVSDPKPDEVIVRVEAAPINPSDLAILLGPADLQSAAVGESEGQPALHAAIPPEAMEGMIARVGLPLVPGNEGAGVVVAAGSNAKALVGKRVGMRGGSMYTQYRKLPVGDCVLLPEGASSADGASMFINPLTALCFIETMRIEKHKALIHFAAASNLGQMLNRICLADGIPLVNIVRSASQAAILHKAGAPIVLDSSDPDFETALTDAIADTGATLCFDPIGGGRQASQVLAAMEAAASRGKTMFSRYGTDVFKQVYIYGTLALEPTVLDRWVGFAWGVGGWLLTYRLRQIGAERTAELQQRVADELLTTFASRYTGSLSLSDALLPENVHRYARRATGEKFLVVPHRG